MIMASSYLKSNLIKKNPTTRLKLFINSNNNSSLSYTPQLSLCCRYISSVINYNPRSSRYNTSREQINIYSPSDIAIDVRNKNNKNNNSKKYIQLIRHNSCLPVESIPLESDNDIIIETKPKLTNEKPKPKMNYNNNNNNNNLLELVPYTPNTNEEVYREIKKLKEWKHALQLLWTVPHDVILQPQIFHIALRLCAHAKPMPQWQEAIALLKEMKERGVIVDRDASHFALHACRMAKKSQPAIEILNRMKKEKNHKCKPDSYTYKVVMDACIMSDEIEKGKSILCKVLKNNDDDDDDDDDNSHHLKIDIKTYNILLRAYSKMGDWRAALTIFNELQETNIIKPDIITYHMIIKAFEKDLKWEEALEVLNDMEKNHGLQPDTLLFNTVADICFKAKKLQEGIAIYKRMNERGYKPTLCSFNIIIDGYGKSGLWQQAMDMIHQLMKNTSCGPDKLSFTSAINACSKAGRHREVIDLLQMMKDKGLPFSRHAYGIAFKGFNRDGKYDATIQLFDSIRHQNNPPIDDCVISTIVYAYANLTPPAIDEAIQLLDEVAWSGNTLTVQMYSSVINACAKHGEWKKAIGLLKEMKSSGLKPDGKCYNFILSACRFGQWEIAIDVLLEKQLEEFKQDKIAKKKKNKSKSLQNYLLQKQKSRTSNNNKNDMKQKKIYSSNNNDIASKELLDKGNYNFKVRKHIQPTRYNNKNNDRNYDDESQKRLHETCVHYTTAIQTCKQAEMWPVAYAMGEWFMTLENDSLDLFGYCALFNSMDKISLELFGPHLYRDLVNTGKISPWRFSRYGEGVVLDLHGYNRSMARSCIKYALEEIKRAVLSEETQPIIIRVKDETNGKYYNEDVRKRFYSDYELSMGSMENEKYDLTILAGKSSGTLRQDLLDFFHKDLDNPLHIDLQPNNLGRIFIKNQCIRSWLKNDVVHK